MHEDFSGSMRSPGGFMFGIQGWTWGVPRPTSITWFLDNTAKVCDQYGRPIRGTTNEGRDVLFAMTPPSTEEKPGVRRGLATHQQVVEALELEKVDWQKLTQAGWPQLPYAELKNVKNLPMTPMEELIKIPNPALKRDAIRIRKEMQTVIDKEREEAGLLQEGYEEVG